MGFLSDLASRLLPSGEEQDSKGAPALESAGDQPFEDQELASFVKRKVEDVRGQASRIAHEGIWMTNIAYALGFDSVYYDTSSRQYKPVGGPLRYPSRNRIHTNKILPAMQNRLARMCKNPPKWETRPEDQSSEAKEAASLAYDVLLDLWEKLYLNEKQIDLCMWLQQCGHSYLVASFDDELGEPLVDPITGEFEGEFEGDINVEVASAFEFFVDPKAKNLEEAKYAVRAKVRDLDYFKDRYERGDLVREESAWLLSTQYELRINSLNNTGPNTSGTSEQMKHAAIELSYYEKRSKKYPRGRHVIVANNILLKNDELFIGEFPFEKWDDIKVAGKFYPEAAVTHARPLQDQFNRNLVRTSEWTNKLLAGKYLAAKGHGLSSESLNDRTEVVEYDMVPNCPPPTAMVPPNIPEYAYKERDGLTTEINMQFGLSEVSQGQLPSAGIPAIGMQLLLEQDETRIGIEIEQHEHAFARFATKILKFAAKGYKTTRQIKKKSNTGYEFISYTGDMLPKMPDVQVIRGSTVPTSRSLRRQEILNIFSQGLLGNPQDPTLRESVLSQLEYGDLSSVWEDQRLDMAQIAKAIHSIKNGEMPEFNKLDNHPLHITKLNRFRKTDTYDSLDDEQKSIVEFLINEHAKTAVEFANPQLAGQIENTQKGLMPDGSDPTSILDAQKGAMTVADANVAAKNAGENGAIEAVKQKLGASQPVGAGMPAGPTPQGAPPPQG